ncbi:hypothetical protein ABPG72_009230 [Tetrahymena utriculariae]
MSYYVFQSSIFFIKNTNSIVLSDVILQQEQLIYQAVDISINQEIRLIDVSQFIICYLKLDFTQFSFLIQPVYDLNKTKKIQGIQLTINQDQKKLIYSRNSILIFEGSNELILINLQAAITYENNYNLKPNQITCIINSSQSATQISSLLKYESSNEYVFGINQNNTIYYANFDNEICKTINISNLQAFQQIKYYSLPTNSFLICAMNQTSLQIFSTYQQNFQSIFILNSNSSEIFLSLEIIQYDKLTKQILILTSSNTLLYYGFYSENKISFLKQELFIINQAKSILPIRQYSNNSQQMLSYQYLIYSQQELQMFLGDQQNNQNTSQSQSIRISKFQANQQIVSGPVTSSVIIEQLQLLIACISTGYIQIYQTTSGFRPDLKYTFTFQGDSCISVYYLNTNFILAQLKQKILIINVLVFQIQKVLQINPLITDYVSIAVNGIYSVFNFNSCLYLIENNEFSTLFQNCEIRLAQNNNQIVLLPEYLLVVQRNQTIIQIQLYLSDQTYKIINQYNFDNQIYFFDFIASPSQAQGFIFDLEEILIIELPETFYTFDEKIIPNFTIQLTGYGPFSTVKRVINDPSAYFMLKNVVNQKKQNTNTLIGIKKQKNPSIIQVSVGAEYSILLEEPIMLSTPEGQQYYQVRQYLNLYFKSIQKEFQIFVQSFKSYISGHTIVKDDNAIQYIKTKKNINKNNIQVEYLGQSSGQIQYSQYNTQRYQELNIQQYLYNQSDIIVTILQSVILNKYLVLTQYQLIVFNIFSDISLGSIPLNQNITAQNIFFVEQINSVLYFCKSQVNLIVYDQNNIKQQLLYQIQTYILDVQYLEDTNQFLIFGEGILLLDENLKLLQPILSQQYQINICKIQIKNLYCIANTYQFLIIDLETFKIQLQQKIQGFQSNNYQILFDQEYDHVLLADNFIQVFNLNGKFLQTIESQSGQIQKIVIEGDYIIISQYALFKILKRKDISFYAEVQSFVGFIIVDFIYIPFLNKISYFCDNSLFVQVVLLDLQSLQIVGRIYQFFSQNGQGLVINQTYDNVGNYLSYIDDLGNFIKLSLYDAFAVLGNVKITQIVDFQQTIVNYSIDFANGNIFVYCTQQIYKINYNQLGDKYNQFSQINQFIFAQIQNDQKLQYLVIGNKNYIYRYQNKTLVYENVLQDAPTILKYLQSHKVLVIAFQGYFNIYQNYQYGQAQTYGIFFKSETYHLNKFIDDDTFITLDKKLIHYDFIQNIQIRQIELPHNLLVTSTYTNNYFQVIVLGFLDGSIIMYNKQTQIIKKISDLVLNSIEVFNNSINFIIEKSSDTLIICTINSQSLELNLQTATVNKQYRLQDLISELKGLKLSLNNLIFDPLNQRIIFQFYSYKYGYVWNLKTNQLDGYVCSGDDQKNEITLTDSYIIVFSQVIINFYTRNGQIKFVTSIRYDISSFQIAQVVQLNSNLVIICTFNYYEIHSISQRRNQLISQKNINNPLIIYSKFNPQTYQVIIIGLSSDGLFQEDINTLNTSNQVLVDCNYQLNNVTALQLYQQIQTVQPIYLEQESLIITKLIKNYNQINYYFIDIESSHLQYLNNILSQKDPKLTQIVIFSPQNQIFSQFQIDKNTFYQLTQPSIYLKDVILNFELGLQEINFNPIIQNIYFQNLTLQNIDDFSGISFNFTNIDQIFIFNLTIGNNTNSQSNLTNSSLDSYLFQFNNVKQIKIYNLNILQNIFPIQKSKNLFLFQNVSNIYIQNCKVVNNSQIENIFTFQYVQNVTIKNAHIINNAIANNNQQNQYSLLQMHACQYVQIKQISFLLNQNFQVLYTTSSYAFNSQVIQLSDDTLSIAESNMANNTNNNQILVKILSSTVQIFNITFTKNQGNILFENQEKIQIDLSNFSQNIGQNGGAISVYSLVSLMLINNSIFYYNQALSSGGAIYIQDSKTKNIYFDTNTIVQKNKALIGGGTRILITLPNSVLPQNYPFYQNIFDNQAEIYGDNTCSFLKNIFIQNSQNLTSNSSIYGSFYYLEVYKFNFNEQYNQVYDGQYYNSKLKVSSFKSGGSITLNFYILDEQNRYLTFSKDKLLRDAYPQDIAEELKYFNILILQQDNNLQLAGQTILNYNVYNDQISCFQITQLTISSSPEVIKYIQIQSNLNKYNQSNINTLIQIEFRPCQVGEVILQQSSTIQICQFCTNGTYSLMDPSQEICKKCPDYAKKCIGNQIDIYNGYWRSNNQTDEIVQCDSMIGSCIAENYQNPDKICKQGYLGPLCEECDMNQTQDFDDQAVRYATSIYSKKCSQCSSIYLQYIFLIFQICAVLTYLLYNSLKFIDNSLIIQTQQYLRNMKILPISKPPSSSQLTSYIKIIINYLQYTSLIISQPSFLPIKINSVPQLLGSSNKIITLSLMCIIPLNIFNRYGKAIVLIFMNQTIPLFFVTLSIALLLSYKNNTIQTSKFIVYKIYNVLQVTYTFFLLDFLSYYTQTLTCRQIGSQAYLTVDLLTKCNDEKFISFIVPYSSLFILVWITAPLYPLYQLRKRKFKLSYCQTRLRYGFYYLELKDKFYYWEFDNTLLGRIIVVTILSIYNYAVQYHNPFIKSKLRTFEILTNKIIIIKVVLSSVNDSYKYIILELCLYMFDLIFIFIFTYYHLRPVLRESEFFQKSKFKLCQLVRKCFCREQLQEQNQSNQNMKILLQWKKIKQKYQAQTPLQVSNLSSQQTLFYSKQHNLSNIRKPFRCSHFRQSKEDFLQK